MCFNREIVKDTLDEIWKIRESWWPQYHFLDNGCPCTDDECLICNCKSMMAVRLTGQGKFAINLLLEK